MAGAMISTVSDVLKYRYMGPLVEQLNNEILINQILSLDSRAIDLDGLQAVVPLHTGRNSGVGARREDEDLPEAGSQKYKKVNYDLAYMYGRARFTGQAIQKTKTDAGAFIRVVTDELDRLRDDLALDTARQYYGDGTGHIAVVASVTASAGNPDEIVLTSDEALQRGFLHQGMTVDIDATFPAAAGQTGMEILDVDPDNSAIYVAEGTAASVAANDIVVRTLNVDADGSKETIGLQALISDTQTSVGGLSPATLRLWDNGRKNVAGGITLSTLMEQWNRTTAAGAKANQITALTTPGVSRGLFEASDFAAKVQFVNTTDLEGGFSSISFNAGSGKVTLVTDRLAPRGKLFFVDKARIKVFSPGDWDFLRRDGLTVRWVDNKDAFQAVLYRYVSLGTGRRNTSRVLYGITDSDF